MRPPSSARLSVHVRLVALLAIILWQCVSLPAFDKAVAPAVASAAPTPLAFGGSLRRISVNIPSRILRKRVVRAASSPPVAGEKRVAFVTPSAESSLHPQARPGIPARLRIPAISVDAPVWSMGLRPDGKMDVPQNRTHVGWYGYGERPGEQGAAVIGAHLELGGKPGMFWNLKDLRVGDTIQVEDEQGTVQTFLIREREQYHVDSAPLQKIFRGTGGRSLHLITCAGVWRADLGHYDERLVIFAELVEEPKASLASA